MDWLLHVLLRVLRYLRLYERVKFGHIDIVGSGGIAVDLGNYRNVLEVRFDDDCHHILPPPCGGGLPDTFEWEVHKKHKRHEYQLDVAWSVQRPRRIVWIASWR